MLEAKFRLPEEVVKKAIDEAFFIHDWVKRPTVHVRGQNVFIHGDSRSVMVVIGRLAQTGNGRLVHARKTTEANALRALDVDEGEDTAQSNT